MPTFDYQCGQCNHHFTAIRTIKERREPENLPCPECDTEGRVDLIMSAPKVVSGVTTTDKLPQGFKDVLNGIKKGSDKDCTIDV